MQPEPHAATGAGMFVGVDRAAFATAFGRALRRAGVEPSLGAVARATSALELINTASRSDLYWVLRVSMASSPADFDTFDRVFAAVFDAERPMRRRGPPPVQVPLPDQENVRLPTSTGDATDGDGLPWATLPSVTMQDAGATDSESLALPELAPAAVAILAERPFDQLDNAEIDQIAAMLADTVRVWPTRPTRRRRPTRSGGRVAPRRTLRRALRRGGEPMVIERERTTRQQRKVAAFIDVSGSMERYARAYLHLLRPLVLQHRAEVFAFATEPHRITAALRNRDTAAVVDQLDATIDDRFSGTRIAGSLAAVYRHRTWSNYLRGAVVLVLSDGWETESPDNLATVMRRIGRVAYRVVWVNPRAAAPGFEPLAGGMAAALPYCDVMVSGHNATSVTAVLDAITT